MVKRLALDRQLGTVPEAWKMDENGGWRPRMDQKVFFLT